MIIDGRVRPPIPETYRRTFDQPEFLKGYLGVYRKSRGSTAYDVDEVRPFWEKPFDYFVEHLDGLGIGRVVLMSQDLESTHGTKVPHEAVGRLIRDFPKRVIGLAGADPHKGIVAASEVQRAIEELGFTGVELDPFLHRLPPQDERYFPIYRKCQELGAPIWIHCSMNWSHDTSIEYGRPVNLEKVLIRFPELTIVAGHTGWPWVNEMMALVWKWPNLYVDTTAMRPKYFPEVGAGYEMLFRLGNTVCQDKVIFGTSWPLLPFRQTIEDVKALPLKPEVREKWFWKNAAKAYKVDQEAA